MYKQPWFENASSKEELIDRTKKELEDHMEGVYSISDDYIQKLLSIKNSYIAHYDGSKVEFDAKADRIRYVLKENRVKFRSIRYEIGPVITLFKVFLDEKTRIAKIQRLEAELSLELGAYGVRLIAPLPGRKDAFGIEVPNEHPEDIMMQSIWNSNRFVEEEKMRLPIALGKTVSGETFLFDLMQARNMLIAGDDFDYEKWRLHIIINSLIWKVNPAELKFVLMSPDPKQFSVYERVSRIYFAKMHGHENESPIINTWQQARNMLNSLMIEMQTRWDLLMKTGCRNIEAYNATVHEQDKKWPYIIVIIDEIDSFWWKGKNKISSPISELSQSGASVGIIFILTIASFCLDVIHEVFMVNFSTRLALSMREKRDSYTTLHCPDAERLRLGGDALYCYRDKLTRLNFGTLSKEEIDCFMTEVANLLTDEEELEQYTLPYCEVRDVAKATYLNEGTVYDPMLADVARLVVARQSCSGSQIQRTFEIGYNRAESLIQQLENIGAVGPDRVPKDREVLVKDLDTLDKILHKFKIC